MWLITTSCLENWSYTCLGIHAIKIVHDLLEFLKLNKSLLSHFFFVFIVILVLNVNGPLFSILQYIQFLWNLIQFGEFNMKKSYRQEIWLKESLMSTKYECIINGINIEYVEMVVAHHLHRYFYYCQYQYTITQQILHCHW